MYFKSSVSEESAANSSKHEPIPARLEICVSYTSKSRVSSTFHSTPSRKFTDPNAKPFG